MSIEKDYSWESTFINSSALPSGFIDSSYLKLEEEATGSVIDDSDSINSTALMKMGKLPLDDKFMTCSQAPL